MFVNYKSSWDKRALALLLAVAVVFVGLPFVGVDTSLKASAETDSLSGKTSTRLKNQPGSTPNNSNGITSATNGNLGYKYTGNILSTQADVYDYVYDRRIDGTTDYYGYANEGANVFKCLNTAISKSGKQVEVPNSKDNNITIKFTDSHLTSASNVYVYLWKSDNSNATNWPGKLMTYDSSSSGSATFKYTFSTTDNTNDRLGFTPDRMIFIWGDDTYNGSKWSNPDSMHYRTEDLIVSLVKGNTYTFTTTAIGTSDNVTFKIQGISGDDIKVYLWNTDNYKNYKWNGASARFSSPYWIYEFDGTYKYGVNDNQINDSTHPNPQNVIFTKGSWKSRDLPLPDTDSMTNKSPDIFGHTFVYETNGLDQNSFVWDYYRASYTYATGAEPFYTVSTYNYPLYFGVFNRNSSGYTDSSKFDDENGDKYNNFYWKSNLALASNSSAAVQGLVDETLDENHQLQQGGVALPYFNSDWANQHKKVYNGRTYDLIKCYEGVSFPFYEVKAKAADIKGDTDRKGYANFYQFYSGEQNNGHPELLNLYLDTSTTPATFKESDAVMKTNGTGEKGFFPFNNNSSQQNNLGFGSRFEIQFKLSSDGKVETYDDNGNGTGTYVDEMFEFMGDDDVWVFIDDKLVLDLGGAHYKTTGLINFANKTAYANDAVAFGNTKNDRDNRNATTGQIPKSLFNDSNGTGIFNVNDNDLVLNSNTNKYEYNDSKYHTMTIFFMERGMNDSNLLIRFNFSAKSNENTMTIKEETDFSNINPGLLEATKKVAEKDVFRYTIANAGTKSTDITSSWILAPNIDKYVRTNNGIETTLSDGSSNGVLYFDNNNSHYVDSSHYLRAWVWKRNADGTDVGGTLYKHTSENNGIYTFDNIPPDSNSVKWLRLNSDYNQISWPDNSLIDKKSDDYSFNHGDVFKPEDENDYSKVTVSSNSRSRDFAPDDTLPTDTKQLVKNVNYLWTDGKAEKTTNYDNNPLAGTTDANGGFYLMYGTSEKESSAQFVGQFKKHNTDTDKSVMTITQEDYFYPVNTASGKSAPAASSSTAGTDTDSTKQDTATDKTEKSSEKSVSSTTAAGTDTDSTKQDTALDKTEKSSEKSISSITAAGTDSDSTKQDTATDKTEKSSEKSVSSTTAAGTNTDKTLQSTTLSNTTAKSSAKSAALNPSAATIGTTATTRQVSDYYTTTVTVKDSKGEPIAINGSSFNYANSTTTANANPNAAVQLTETFCNSPILGAITIKKEKLDPADDVDETFNFTIKFTKVFGQEVSLSTEEYNKIAISYTKNGTTTTDTLDPNGGFSLKPEESVTIWNIPVYTYYEITETETDNYKIKSSTNLGGSDNPIVAGTLNPNEDTYTYTPNYKGKNTATIVNTRRLGKLTLNKTLVTNNSTVKLGNGTIDENTEFEYEVTLKTPNNIKLSNYESGIEIKKSDGTTISGLTKKSDYEYKCTVKVSAKKSVEITGIPYGTEYTVKETTTGSFAQSGSGTDGTISKTNASASATITNTTPKLGSLTIKKTLSGNFTNHQSDTFTFNVTIKSDYNLNDFDINWPSGITYDSSTKTATGTVTITGSGSVTIDNLPYGTSCETTYDVQEDTSSFDENDKITVSGEVTNARISSDSQTATINNHYDTTKVYHTITLTKTDLNGNKIQGVEFVLLKLKDGVDENHSEAVNAFKDLTAYTALSAYYDTAYDSQKQTTNANGIATFQDDPDNGVAFSDGNYFLYEVNVPSGYEMDNTLTASKIITINDTQLEYSTTYTNKKKVTSVDVTVQKKDEDDENKNTGLDGAEFDLYFRESTVYPTYSFNNELISPTQNSAVKVSSNGMTVPDPQPASSNTVTTYTYTYNNPATPSAADEDWILPRTDNDYIYFRDYNTGTAGEHDKKSFTDSGSNAQAQNANRSWLYTNLKGNDYSQNLEIDYDHTYWVAAQFTKDNNGTGFVEYAVWERFVDRYNSQDTVVWKIQPPDGYKYVRFCLYDVDSCIRTTNLIEYKLGEIYHKTNWGGSYANQNSKDCYFNVPVAGENGWSTYYGTDSPQDQRMSSSSTNLKQADRYEPTEQKIIFHCNSQQVWHNIHIEFFDENKRPIHQSFPGYMMEPYAYAGSDYRLSNGYLTYELTIPADAKYFRINNGVALDSGSPYAYRTNIQEINTSGGKNYNNYYTLGSNAYKRYNCSAISEAPLNMNVSQITSMSGESTSATYSSTNVESDGDFIYFAKPSTWTSDTVYAYFYGGGNLREDNWQRACYSIWPGVAPVGTEFKTYNSEDTLESAKHSDIYNYSYNLNPESTFTMKIGNENLTVYKFRIPEGDRKNYSKVIFNDGLSTKSGSHETSPITYNAGYIYKSNGGAIKHYDGTLTTYTYTPRSTSDDDYIYIKVPKTDSTWDDPHITFYNSNGTQVLQSGKGYVMEYSGTEGEYNYFRIPIPADSYNAVKFKINNGMGKSDNYNKSTDYSDILRKSSRSSEANDASDYTENRLVYTLSDTNISLTSPTFTKTVNTTTTLGASQDSRIDYTTRGDKLNIRNTADWNIDVGGGLVKFYKADGTLITGDGTKGNGTYVLIKTVNDGDATPKAWYTIEIPTDAVSFTLTYANGTKTTARNPIYPLSADGSTTDANGNYTEDGMYYETTSGGSLKLIEDTVEPQTSTDSGMTARSRGDTLYLLCTSKTAWYNMTVTFKDSSGTAISGAMGVIPTYVNKKDNDHWWSIDIPENAASFTVTKGGNTTAEAEIYPLAEKLSRYKKDYTLGDMQYRLPDPASTTKPTLLYPIFTEDDEYTLEISKGNSITSASGANLVDESKVSDYASATAYTASQSTGSELTNPYPVLYNTTSNNLTYSWGGSGTADTNYVKLCDPSGKGTADTWKAWLWDEGSAGEKIDCESTYETDSNGYKVYKFNITGKNKNNIIFTTKPNVGSSNGWGDGYQTNDLDISGYNYGHGYTYTLPWTETLATETEVTDGSYVYFKKPNAAYKSPYQAASWNSLKVIFSNGTSSETYDKNDSHITTVSNLKDTSNTIISGEFWRIAFDSTKNWTKVTFYDGDYGQTIDTSTKQARSKEMSLTNYLGGAQDTGKMNYFYLTYTSEGIINGENNTTGPIRVKEYSNKVEHEASWTQSVDTTTYTATYQPEDRYGMISVLNSSSTTVTADTNNFIYIDTAISDPYIMFYDGNNNAIGGNSMAKSGISLSGVDSTGSPYSIRLPKNAKSFKIASGASGTLGSAIPLVENITVNSSGRIATGDETTEISNYHHAGTKFEIATDGTVTSKTLRSNFTISKTTDLNTQNPKKDTDYVYFTDTSGEFKGTSGTVYAYFYGSADGAFKDWPGIVAESTYTDNSGNTVYRFCIPQDSNGKYDYVIFNNGSAANRKITQAIKYDGGHNYILDTTTSKQQQYGTYSNTNPNTTKINAYAVTDDDSKAATNSGTPYTTQGTNKFIYIENNGTQNYGNDGELVNGQTYKLDDMHIVFYDINKNIIGGYVSGFIPDKLSGVTSHNNDVYRIQVPNDAVYFQITNGAGKGNGTTEYNSRQSEIKLVTSNGLYQFVTETESTGTLTAEDYIIGEDVPNTADKMETVQYLLDLANKKTIEKDDDIPETETYDVKLATIVTKADGTQKYIKWLRQVNGTVDRTYLNHEDSDIGATGGSGGNGVKVVNVVKDGTYYWVETVAPKGYELNEEIFEFTKSGNTLSGSNISDGSVTIKDKKKTGGTVILTKRSKERVGTNAIGQPLEGATFWLYKIDENGNGQRVGTTVYTTDKNGQLTIENLEQGDYYLKEQTAPKGYTDGNKQEVYFTIGANEVGVDENGDEKIKYITCYDEMEPAYIQLYEHINERRAPNWGDPTFIFKITQTNDADGTPISVQDRKTQTVALTVNDDGKRSPAASPTAGLANNTELGYNYNDWYEESTLEKMENNGPFEYGGMFNIINTGVNGGSIRLEPGTYQITRVPVQRYKFVENTWKLKTEDNTVYETNRRDNTESRTLTVKAGETAIVHYYDKVDYYDKFTHVDTKINQFYQLDANKANKTIKGIRVEYNTVIPTSGTTAVIQSSDSAKFKVYYIYADGTEVEMKDANEKAKIKFITTGTNFEGIFKTNDTGTTAFTISNPNGYANNVYTIKASYTYTDAKATPQNTTFTTSFDIKFDDAQPEPD